MAQEEIIAKRYAAGLAERAAELNEVPRVRSDLRFLAGLVGARPEHRVGEMTDFLVSPRISAEEKLAAADGILDKLDIGGTTKDFFKLLIEHRRADLLPRIDARFNEIAGDLTGEHVALVETAMKLDDDQMGRLGAALTAALGRTVRLRQRIEPGLIAGARVTVGDKTFDGSVLGKWRRLRNRLSSGVATECARACDIIDAKNKGEPVCEKS